MASGDAAAVYLRALNDIETLKGHIVNQNVQIDNMKRAAIEAAQEAKDKLEAESSKRHALFEQAFKDDVGNFLKNNQASIDQKMEYLNNELNAAGGIITTMKQMHEQVLEIHQNQIYQTQTLTDERFTKHENVINEQEDKINEQEDKLKKLERT